jgi:5-formyltetrahydrofolate cyclo-ligase
VHSSQLVDGRRVFMMPHDSPLDYVATEKELIVTGNTSPRPKGVAWDYVQPDQFETIPFLRDLRDRMLARG